MGSINSRPLKAFVRYDGSHRIVAGSLILRKNKPKVGKWKEISAYECCNFTPTTTTTTTTVAPTTTTTTTVAPTTTTTTTAAYVTWEMAASNISSGDACTGGSGIVTLYSATSPLTNGMVLYSNTGLTIPLTSGWYANPANSTVYEVNVSGVILSQALCV
jgi:hypothetical protein